VVAETPGADAFPTADLVEPEPVTWCADDAVTLHGLRYTPRDTVGPGPLLVTLHGGPTDEATVDWDPRVQVLVARGWTVFAPNVRGSTGYGRAYMEALHGGWGERDVDDVIAGIRAATAEGWADPKRVALIGGSSGAFTALLVAIRVPDVVHGIVASYPVTDLRALAAETHRFEAHYSDTLIGTLPDCAATYRARSPITHAAALRTPMLVLQGRDDVVVPASHVIAFVDAVRAAGGDVELQLYDGEGHGFSQPTTRADAFRRTDDFLARTVLAR
jgi:dipeptidyl aminopeptidase/acylaminoacyl peptidase